MNIADFDYELPADRIAQEPLPERDGSRLMRLGPGDSAPTHHRVSDLPDLLRAGDLLVVNRSRVLPARLLGRRSGGGAAEVLLLGPVANDAAEQATAEAFVRPGRRTRPGDVIQIDDDLTVAVDSAATGADGRRQVRLRSARGDLRSALARAGHVPLPPYIRRPDHATDRERYQTVYAREEGSIAAPTAGLHFTERLLARLDEKGVARTEVVLHVGPGTFRPVTAQTVEDHRLEAEPYQVPPEAAEAVRAARARGGRVVAVGTTTVRTLESAARGDRTVAPGTGQTGLVIVPGFAFRVVDVLLTNFHLPRSSLLLLVSALAGRERVLAAYAEAVRSGYRFYSYGDAMLIG